MSYKPAATTKFGANPALPACAKVAVQDGDPAKAGSFMMLKAAAGCTLPWHWHNANERLIIISGSARADMQGGSSTVLKPGDFLLMPAKGIHQLHATTALELFNVSDAPFDIHYVDASGKEISPADALKPATKVAGKK